MHFGFVIVAFGNLEASEALEWILLTYLSLEQFRGDDVFRRPNVLVPAERALGNTYQN